MIMVHHCSYLFRSRKNQNKENLRTSCTEISAGGNFTRQVIHTLTLDHPYRHGCPDRRSVIGPVRKLVRSVIGPVRRSGIPDRTKLVRIFGTEFRTKFGPETIVWSGPDFKRILYGPQKIDNYDSFSFHGTSCDEKTNLVNKLFPKVDFFHFESIEK